jgi:FkbH-like protein
MERNAHSFQDSASTRAAGDIDLKDLPKLRIALLSDAATQLLVPLLRDALRRGGISAEIYEAPFAATELEVFNPSSDLYAFTPDVVVLLNCTQALRSAFLQRETSPAFVEEVEARIVGVWNAIHSNTSARIIQSNYVAPYERLFGNYELKHAGSWSSAVAEINRRIVLAAREHSNVLLNDMDGLASWLGRRAWFDERFWDLAKCCCAVEYLPALARNISDIVLAGRGRAVKCVIVDLDNTLWGGVVGDDGLDGLELSAHGNGEAFHRFQSFLLGLKQRGILLCVCSKNEYAAAIKPFEEHPEMVLRKDDITVFVANWENKADNVRRIRDSLAIGYDAMVFIDDNPFERNAVRALLPDVIVPELPEDPADYTKALSELNLFEATAFTAEDNQRASLYRAECERRSAAGAFSNFEEYLEWLNMRIEVARFEPSRLRRITQLLQRSNQFNLTTHRYNESECETMMLDLTCIPLYASLRDRFGDHGLISIIVARADLAAGSLDITDWLMSCRVLARGVEEYLMNYVIREAARLNLECVAGTYVPSAKNAMVRDFFARFGFTRVSDAVDGTTRWRLRVGDHKYRETHIRSEISAQAAAAGAL